MGTLLAFAVIAVLSGLGVGAMRRFAHAHSILDVPNERSSHTRSVPRGGGVPIVVFTIAGTWLLVTIKYGNASRALTVYTLAAILIAIISGLDDLYSISNVIRFSVHSIAAALVIYGLGYLPLRNIVGGSPWFIDSLSIVITFLWLVGLTNAYNFMDGIDGIAGSQAVIAGLGWAILGEMTNQGLVMALGLVVAASSLGFLLHNWSPARIFMGDVASAFLGFTLATLPLIFNAQSIQSNRGLRVPFFGLVLVWPFVFDATITFFRRLFKGERVFSAHRSHLYQRLVIAGRTHQFVTVLYSMLAAAGAILALLWIAGVRSSAAVFFTILPLFCIGVLIFVSREEHTSRVGSGADLRAYRDPSQLAIDSEP